MGPSTVPATGQRNKREGFERPARGHESLDGCPRTGPGEQRGRCPWRGPPCRWVRPCDKAEVWHCVFGKCEHGSREFVLPAMTQNTGDFDRDGREIQNTEVRERGRLGKRFRGGRGGVVMPAPGPSGWPRPVSAVIATFRGFATSENMSQGK